MPKMPKARPGATENILLWPMCHSKTGVLSIYSNGDRSGTGCLNCNRMPKISENGTLVKIWKLVLTTDKGQIGPI